MRGVFLWGLCVLGAWSCSSDTTTSPDASIDSPSPSDAAKDTTTPDTGVDTGVSDAGDASSGDAGVVYNDIGDPSKWTVFSLGPNVSFAANELTGATFDGKYVYFAPATYGIVVRYDTTASFTTSGSWTLFDLGPVDNAAKGMAGAVFDGKFVYVVPANNSRTIRYDTTAPFTSVGSWAKYNFSVVSTETTFGGVYDGRYVYVVPKNASTVIRHDTQGAGFTNAGSWSAYAVGALVDAGAPGFATGGFDGKYVYAVPQNGQAPIVVRYDSTSTFTQAGSWTSFDVSAVSAQARDFEGAVFDGRYMYFVPYKDQSNGYGGKAVRYDTTKPFAQTASWESFDTAQVNANAVGFNGGQFDGRYVYFAPFGSGNGWGGTTIRFDTQGTFTNTSSWKAFDMTVLDAQAHAMKGVVYDGRYLYYVPWLSGIVTRFDTKTPPSLPKPTASFF